MKQNDFLDLIKYILAFMIVAIHSGLFPYVLFPFLRVAVPLFFMISSYLLFTRLNNAEDNQKFVCVKKYVLRNLKYYFFWFIILLPYTVIVRRHWIDKSALVSIRTIVTNLLFSSSYPASWYIIASIWAIIILYLTRKINWKYLLIVLSLVYLICCILSGYNFVITNEKVIIVIDYYEKIFTSPVFSFPVATFWMFLGKVFADHHNITISNSLLICGTILFAILVRIEWKFITNLGGDITADCLILLAPLSICIFALIKKVNIKIKNAKTLRAISTVMYPSHTLYIYIY